MLIVGPLALSALAVALGVLEPDAAGALIVVWCLGIWFCWRFGTQTEVVIQDGELFVTTPLRSYRSLTSEIVKADWVRGRMTVLTRNGGRFAIPFYTETPFIRLVPRLQQSREALATALINVVQAGGCGDEGPKPEVRWVAPPTSYLVLAAVLGLAGELAVLVG